MRKCKQNMKKTLIRDKEKVNIDVFYAISVSFAAQI